LLVEAIQTALANETTVNTLLGSPSSRPDSTNGIFPSQAPDQPTMPYVVVSQGSGEPLGGPMMSGTGALTTESWKISCHGSTYRAAKILAKAVRLFLLSWNGAQTAAAVTVSGAFCSLEADETEALGRGTLFSTDLDFELIYTDTL